MILSHTAVAYTLLGKTNGTSFVWAHGWGHTHTDFIPLVRSLEGLGCHALLDLPGFGQSPTPLYPCGTADYGEAIAPLLSEPVVWIGHSFGAKVGLMMAARYPHLIKALVMIASPGLPRRRRLWIKVKIAAFKAAKRLFPDTAGWWFGSPDYKNAGVLRPTFVRIVNENMTEEAKVVQCPTLLLYGAKDTDTPPELGQRLCALIPGARIEVIPHLDHSTILTKGQHIIAARIKDFIV